MLSQSWALGVIKRKSQSPVERLVSAVCYWFQASVWFEVVDSDSNFADGISRDLHEDSFSRKLGVTPCECFVHIWMWSDPLTQVWASFERAALGNHS